ncbi:protein cueball-like [Helicoverpa zea]|uniref:protein cueball-like n=1 Tax=Helicoverpa zea TaxID=7113 RepID=UPI001F58B9ED|nr:protein cueball-like [Helicoverpa zea]
MYKLLSVWALVVLSVQIVHSWDYALALEKRIDFFKNDTITHSITSHQFKNLTALAYDALHDTLLIVDQQTNNSSVYRFNFTSNDFQAILTRKEIISFAIDPVKELLFWIEDKSIHSMTLKPSHENNLNERIVLRLDEENPRAIAVDICSGFVYWTSTSSIKPAIEKVRFDGSDRAVLIDQDIQEPHRLVIDPQINKMFWIDIRHDDTYTYRVKYSDLEGNNESWLLQGTILPRALTVSKDFVYLIENEQKADWKYSKLGIEETLKQIGSSYSEIPSSIVAKYTLEEQTKGIQNCKALTSLLQDNSENETSRRIISELESLICVHGEKANATSCTCAPGYIGERCDVSVCQNYCIQGTCSVSDEGEPSCGCESGYSGARCDINMCFNYCLNNGVCYFTEENEPLCQCSGNYRGSRCEAIGNDTVSPTFSSGDKNYTLVDLLFNRRKVNGKFIVNFEVESE